MSAWALQSPESANASGFMPPIGDARLDDPVCGGSMLERRETSGSVDFDTAAGGDGNQFRALTQDSARVSRRPEFGESARVDPLSRSANS